MKRSFCRVAPVALLAACSSTPPTQMCTGPVDIVDIAAFQLLPVGRDPFEPADAGVSDASVAADAGLLPPRGRCDSSATVVEDLGGLRSFSIITRDCARATVEAPTIVEVKPNEPVTIRLWHYSLLLFDKTEGRIDVAIGDQTVWTATVAIPTESKLTTATVQLPNGAPIGTPIKWHVANHGSNSWNFVNLSVEREAPCPPDAGNF